jgi:hypothetical protein
VLRSGWEAEDLAVAVSCSSSPAPHIQADSGTIVVGTRGAWLIADPGYQQYAGGEEREFTIGPAAHNAPLVNGHPPTRKRPRRLALEDLGRGVCHTAVDLSACYPPEASVKRVVRHVWLAGRRAVVVADCVGTAAASQLIYHWHGHPAAAWWFENGWALLSLEPAQLWLTCPQGHVCSSALRRLPGSRGQLSLVARFDRVGPVVWWVFTVDGQRPAIQTTADSRQMTLGGDSFHAE